MQMISFVFIGFTLFVYSLLYVGNRFANNDATRVKLSKGILLAASYVFMLYADVRFALILLILSVTVWYCAKNMRYYRIGIILSLAALGYFKYTNFFMESFARLVGNDFVALNIIMPLGISYYTFSAIGYLIDVKRDRIAARNIEDVALYLSFFPKITSGPIQRSKDFFEQTDLPLSIGWKNLSEGIQIFCFGLFKKIVIADHLSVFVDQVYRTPNAFSSYTILLAVIGYSMQIYFDFSGYSDMAIAVAKMLGIQMPRNFNLPYLSHNVTELWKRWHISLSSWLQDYLYISLGGNRKGTVWTYINLILTMVIGGIWHGPKWTYIVWGFMHGVALAVHKIWVKYTGSNKKPHSVGMNIASIIVTFCFTTLCWIFFRTDTMTDAMLIIKRLFSFETGITHHYIWVYISLILLLISSIAAYRKSCNKLINENKQNTSVAEGYYPKVELNGYLSWVLFFVACGLIIGFACTNGSPFIYGQY